MTSDRTGRVLLAAGAMALTGLAAMDIWLIWHAPDRRADPVIALSLALLTLIAAALVALFQMRQRNIDDFRIESLTTQRVAESRDLLQAVIDGSTDPIYVKDLEGRFVLVNRRTAEVLGAPLDSIVGKRDRDFLDLETALPLEQVDREVMHQGQMCSVEEHVPENGVMRVFLSAKVPWTRNNAVVGLIGISRDITDRVAAESDLRRLNDELDARVSTRTAELTQAIARLERESAEREIAEQQVRQMQKLESIGQLTGGIAHDFNNMLAIIMGSLELAGRRLTGSEHQRVTEGIANAQEAAKSAADLTARLLAFARQQPLAPQSIDPNTLVAAMSELLRRTIGESIQLETVLAGGVWHVNADPSQLENAILNIALNARDAMPEGGCLKIVTKNAALAKDGGGDETAYVVISVSDTGCGMPPEIVARVFEPFFTTKPLGKGTGLGLSQVFGFVTQSGGYIEIDSEADAGTTVDIYLPRCGAANTSKAVEPIAQIPRATSGETVLVVEDEEKVRRVAVEALSELGYAVRDADDAKAALTLLQEAGPVSLLFTDIVMPGMNGYALAETARTMHSELKILYTTGYTPDAAGLDQQGENIAMLAKPYALDDLARKVRAALDT